MIPYTFEIPGTYIWYNNQNVYQFKNKLNCILITVICILNLKKVKSKVLLPYTLMMEEGGQRYAGYPEYFACGTTGNKDRKR